PHRRLRAASGRGGGAEAGVRRRSARGRPCARRLRRGAGPAATARPRGADPSRPGTGRPALRGAAGRVRHRGGRRPRRTGALAAGLLGDLVSDQAPACAAPVPAPDPGPSGEVGAGRRAAGAARRLTAPHERQRHAAAQSALATGRAPGFGTAPAGRPARRAGGVVAAGLAATPAIEGLQAADEGILYICCATIAYMPARERLPPWHERQRLPNGREVLIRPIRPEDADPLRASFSLLQPEEVRQRFLQSMKSLPEDMLERLTRVNPKTEFALVAAEPLPPGEALVGAVARVTADPEGEQGEFAILVSHYVAGQGLGRYLMTRLVKWARARSSGASTATCSRTTSPCSRWPIRWASSASRWPAGWSAWSWTLRRAGTPTLPASKGCRPDGSAFPRARTSGTHRAGLLRHAPVKSAGSHCTPDAIAHSRPAAPAGRTAARLVARAGLRHRPRPAPRVRRGGAPGPATGDHSRQPRRTPPRGRPAHAARGAGTR